MGKKVDFVKTTLIGGILFLFPLAFIGLILGKAFQIMTAVAKPIDKLIPIEHIGGIAFVNIVTVLILIFACFAAGLFAQSKYGQRIFRKIDNTLKVIIPGYAAYKDKITSALGEQQKDNPLKPVIVKLDDQSILALEVERAESGEVIVFLPSSPDPWSGAVAFVAPDRVEPVPTDVHKTMNTYRMLGRGTVDALRGAKDKTVANS